MKFLGDDLYDRDIVIIEIIVPKFHQNTQSRTGEMIEKVGKPSWERQPLWERS